MGGLPSRAEAVCLEAICLTAPEGPLGRVSPIGPDQPTFDGWLIRPTNSIEWKRSWWVTNKLVGRGSASGGSGSEASRRFAAKGDLPRELSEELHKFLLKFPLACRLSGLLQESRIRKEAPRKWLLRRKLQRSASAEQAAAEKAALRSHQDGSQLQG